jgi:drug/metabolite transporter superfamily protein YnfA
MFTFQALQILIFLIPGFIASTVLNMLVVRVEQKQFGKVVEALVFTLIIFVVYSFVSQKSPIQLSKVGENVAYSYDSHAFLWLVGISIVIPVIMSALVTHDLHMKLARSLRISKKTARTSVWVDVFYDLDNYIIVNFKDGRSIFGWPTYFSTDPDQPYIFLSEPAWYEEDKFQPVKELEGILITPEHEIESIEVLKD